MPRKPRGNLQSLMYEKQKHKSPIGRELHQLLKKHIVHQLLKKHNVKALPRIHRRKYGKHN